MMMMISYGKEDRSMLLSLQLISWILSMRRRLQRTLTMILTVGMLVYCILQVTAMYIQLFSSLNFTFFINKDKKVQNTNN